VRKARQAVATAALQAHLDAHAVRQNDALLQHMAQDTITRLR
jgi:hypothetical protein